MYVHINIMFTRGCKDRDEDISSAKEKAMLCEEVFNTCV